MKVVILALALAAAAAAQPITNKDIRQMQQRHERSPGYVKSPTASKLPPQFSQMSYQKPAIRDWLLPYLDWEQKDRAYFLKNYGQSRLDLRPSMIVMHYTVIASTEDTYNALSRKRVSVHFMVAPDGTVYRLLPTDRRCTGAYGVDHLALSIEMVATSEADLLARSRQVFSSFCLVRWLMKEHAIPSSGVIAHYEVSEGKRKIPQYTDLYDTVYPDRYPPGETRTDPGPTYMAWLRTYLRENASP